MDMEPADDRPDADVEEANVTEPIPLEEVRLGTSGGISSSSTSSSKSGSWWSRSAVLSW